MKHRYSLPLLLVFMLITASSTTWADQMTKVKQVVLISIDGLRADAVSAENMPLLHQRMLKTGLYGLKASNVMPSKTLPNHTSMLSGLDPAHHEVLFNREPFLHKLGAPGSSFSKPTLFTVIKSKGGSTAAFVAKQKLSYLFSGASLDHVFIETKARKSDYIHAASSKLIVDEFIQATSKSPYTFTFIHLKEADRLGHQFAWMSSEYLQGVRAIDLQLQRLLDFIQPQNTSVIITADHGGTGTRHGDDIPSNRTIPWIAFLRGNRIGQELNSPISNLDTASTILDLLGPKWPNQVQGKILDLGP